MIFQDSILDATEDQQLEAAMRASMEQSTSPPVSSSKILPDLTDDSLDEDDELETFTDSDTEASSAPNTPVKLPPGSPSKRTANSTVQKGNCDNSKQSGSLNSAHKNGTGSQVLRNSGATDSADGAPQSCEKLAVAESGNKNGMQADNSKSAGDVSGGNKKSSWRDYLGESSGPECKLQIRFPDGRKEQLNIPSSSQLMVSSY